MQHIATVQLNPPTVSEQSEPLAEEEVCPICKGLGWVRDDVPIAHPSFGREIRCTCVRDVLEQQRLDKLFQQAGVPPRFRGMTLDGIPPNHRDRKHLALAAAEMYMEYGYVVYTELGRYSPVVASHMQEIPRGDEPRKSLL